MYIYSIMIWDGIDQRKFPRVKYRCLIRIAEHGQEDRVNTFTENVGSGGICVVVNKAFEIFDTIGLELYLDEGKLPISCRGTIVWVVRRYPVKGEDIAEFDTGIEFVDMSEEDRGRISSLVEGLLEK